MKAKINWSKLVIYILEDLFFSQKELAELCNVTQQSISNWKMEVRSPGPYAKRKLTEIAENHGIRPSSFRRSGNTTKDITKDGNLLALIEIYNELPEDSLELLLDFARFLSMRNQ
jgi:transcriptional regulator with XRE-family HTH domain